MDRPDHKPSACCGATATAALALASTADAAVMTFGCPQPGGGSTALRIRLNLAAEVLTTAAPAAREPLALTAAPRPAPAHALTAAATAVERTDAMSPRPLFCEDSPDPHPQRYSHALSAYGRALSPSPAVLWHVWA